MGFKKTLALVGLVMGLAVPAAQAAVRAGHSGWEWADPLPQGHTINAVDLSGSVAYAAGDFGTLLRSDDGGLTWAGLATGVTADLERVTAVDADSVVVAGRCLLRRSDDAGATFTRLPWTLSDDRCVSPIAGVTFPTEQQGYLALQDGSVHQTADGGRTWTRVTDPPSAGDPTAPPTDVVFTSLERGVLATSTGLLYRTTDAGTSWELAHRAAHGLRSIEFVDSLLGFAAGEGGTVLRTLDGGRIWVDVPSNTTGHAHGDPLRGCLGLPGDHRRRQPPAAHDRRWQDLRPAPFDRGRLRGGDRPVVGRRGRGPVRGDDRVR